jgi:hypothetical protein
MPVVEHEVPEAWQGRGPPGDGEPPYEWELDKRLTVLETKLGVILPTLATKEDLAKQSLVLVFWLVATAIAIVGILISYLNFSKPAPAPASPPAPQPIVIQLAPASNAAPAASSAASK